MDKENKEYYQNIAFDEGVFSEELKDVAQRNLIDNRGKVHNRTEGGLLDFDDFLAPKAERSPCLNQVLTELTDVKHDAAWQKDETTQHKGLVG